MLLVVEFLWQNLGSFTAIESDQPAARAAVNKMTALLAFSFTQPSLRVRAFFFILLLYDLNEGCHHT
jgi:hypothetical protein